MSQLRYCGLRAFVLHHYLPHDRTIFGKLKDPVYLLLTAVTLLPVHLLRVAFFSAILLMIVVPGPPDEFQLVSFILNFKGTQFLNAGLLMMARGALEYFACFSFHKDRILQCVADSGPGAEGSLFLGVMDYLGSCLLVWVAFWALPHSKKYVVKKVGRLERQDRKGTDGVNTNGVTANVTFSFGTPVKSILPRMPGRTFLPIRQNSLLLQRPH